MDEDRIDVDEVLPKEIEDGVLRERDARGVFAVVPAWSLGRGGVELLAALTPVTKRTALVRSAPDAGAALR